MKVDAKDRIRQLTVAVGAVVAIAGAAWGSGAFGGTPIEEAAGGALAPDATLLAAAKPAFQIWSVIYAGLVLFAVVQALPSRASLPRYRESAWWILASMALNAAWIGVVQAGWIAASVFVLGAIVATLVKAGAALGRAPRDALIDRAASDIPMGLYLGWASVATAANIAAAVGEMATPFALALVALVLVFTMTLVWRLGSRPLGVAIAVAVTWGLTWIGVARLDAPQSTLVATGAFVAAGLAALTGVLRLLLPSESRRG